MYIATCEVVYRSPGHGITSGNDFRNNIGEELLERTFGKFKSILCTYIPIFVYVTGFEKTRLPRTITNI